MSQSASVDQSASVVSHRGIGVPEEAIRNQGSDRQSDEAFDVIRRAILRCELRPGELVSETDLMARFGLRRAATRSALDRLSVIGLLRSLPRRGYVVKSITLRDVNDLFQLRGII